MADVECPEDLRYTPEHGWVRAGQGLVRIGITAYAEGALGDIVYVALPRLGDRVEAGAVCGELESTTTVSDLYAPLSGVVTARNESLEGSPELVNSDPYGDGWVLEVRPDDPAAVEGLLDAAGYRASITRAG
ncbi:glycine cleavage system protein GcvH [Quadrisphaera sp. DSM 44207]|uniref:glycine cleavage system protein GcvH n=1 Tax=Quadrisphaera sp. DSM 44207 TaxID=1881057 RepID=UPI0008926A1B|nr:glycine cleavage system protein GcvH [Quadrisphaera sp. DSM 44207]SDQ39268.1 glycine cleavage system H protein [Quadrisphaera sp. DSM 44207]